MDDGFIQDIEALGISFGNDNAYVGLTERQPDCRTPSESPEKLRSVKRRVNGD